MIDELIKHLIEGKFGEAYSLFFLCEKVFRVMNALYPMSSEAGTDEFADALREFASDFSYAL